MTANEAIRDALNAYAWQFDRARAGLNREALVYINTIHRPAVAELLAKRLVNIERRGRDLGPRQTARYNKMLAELDGLIKGNYASLREAMTQGLASLGVADAAIVAKLTAEAAGFVPLGLSMTLPSKATVNAIVRGEAVKGRLMKEWFSHFSAMEVADARAIIETGILSGQSTDEIVRGIVGTRRAGYADSILQASRNRVITGVRTAATQVSARVRQETFEASADVLKGYQFVATLDLKTTIECRLEDGTLILIGMAGSIPPLHFNCRSSLNPVVKSWRELGIDLDEAPKGTRESLDGRAPETETSVEWFKKQSFSRQKESIGAWKAQRYRAGDLKLSQMIDSAGRELSNTALAAKYDLVL